MKSQLSKGAVVVLIALTLCAYASLATAQNTTVSFKLLDYQTGLPAYTLNIVVPQPLLDYYREKNHAIYSSQGFSKFVTPYSVKPIADRLWEIYQNEEDFANAALAIVHQMNYVETTPGSYPVETLVEGKGDCDIFSFVAASIINAGGLEVVLFHYEEKKHMNIGVRLDSPPEDTRSGAYKMTYEGESYYIAECTGGNWTTGWRVGECPENLKSATAQVLSLANAETVAPGQVSASFTKLEDSNLNLEVSPPFTIENGIVEIHGSLTPNIVGENITIYFAGNGQQWRILVNVPTKQDGRFDYAWKSEIAGIYGIRASWGGDKNYAGSTSQTTNAIILPIFLTMLLAVAIAAIVLTAIAVAVSKQSSQINLEPAEPQPPAL